MMLTVAATVAGAALGYAAERAMLRPRLTAPPRPGPPLGSVEGELREVSGPADLTITTESYGDPDAPQVVLAHGWTCTGRVWHEQVVGLADRLRLITYDQPGHGRTSAPKAGDYRFDLFGDALAAVIEQTTRPGPLVLVGHSLGGMTVLNAARRYPALMHRVTGVVLLSTSSRAQVADVEFGFGLHGLARFEQIVSRLINFGPPAALEVVSRVYDASTDLSFLLTRQFGLTRAADPHYVDFTEQLVLDADVQMMATMLPVLLRLDEDDSLDCLACPTTILVGDDDWLTAPVLSRRMAQRCHSAELIELEGIGHMTPLEAHEEVNRIILCYVNH